ncbi:hypothetical protein GQ600_16769 [Phytophthora cactorum]|nr:hypothetical protein GQ600_16769 [Phytophthora cactorum]
MPEVGVEEVARELLCARGTVHVWGRRLTSCCASLATPPPRR